MKYLPGAQCNSMTLYDLILFFQYFSPELLAIGLLNASYLFIRTEELRATVCALRVLLGGVLGAVYIGPLNTKHLFGMQRCIKMLFWGLCWCIFCGGSVAVSDSPGIAVQTRRPMMRIGIED